MLVAEHESLVTQVEKLADLQYRSDDNKEDQLSNLSYGEPPRTSSGLSFHGGASPIPIPVPAPASSIPGLSSGLPSSSEDSSDKENSAPGTQQSIVTELVAMIEEDHLDIGGESSHVMACLSQTGIFHVLFALFFFNTYDLYLSRSYLINNTTLVSYHFACSLHSQMIRKHVY